LEQIAENTALHIGTSLGERVYAEELDIQAELDAIGLEYETGRTLPEELDVVTEIALLITGINPLLLSRGKQVFLRRRAPPINGFGIEYSVSQAYHEDEFCNEICKYCEIGLSAKADSDRIISSRDFGTETLGLLYHPNWKGSPGKFNFEDFYGRHPIFQIYIYNDNKVFGVDFYAEFYADNRVLYALGIALRERTFDTNLSEFIEQFLKSLCDKVQKNKF
jgi:hypothetical protein